MEHTFKCPKCGGNELRCITKGLMEESTVAFSADGTPLPGDTLETFYDAAFETYECTGCQEAYTADEVKAIVRGEFAFLAPDDFQKATECQRTCCICSHLTREYRCGRTGVFVGFSHPVCEYLAYSDRVFGGNLDGLCKGCVNAIVSNETHTWRCLKGHNMYEKTVAQECEDDVEGRHQSEGTPPWRKKESESK